MTNSNKKSVIENQKYENYWKLTVEYTNIHQHRFLNTLHLIVDFIDNHKSLKENYESKYYKMLQDQINNIYQKVDMASTRKSINQMVKLGFIKPYLSGYHTKTKEFLNAPTEDLREILFSEIYYQSANLQSSVTKDFSDIKHINFFLKTLMYKKDKQLNKEEIIALISSDITRYKNGYMTDEELEQVQLMNKITGFANRKYNQVAYFMHFLNYVPGITVNSKKDKVVYNEDAHILLHESIDVQRDPTMFRIMKEKIKEESKRIYGREVCYFTKKSIKGLVVSHIVGSAESLRKMDIETAYDYKNALLLEPNTDTYFDKHDLTFTSDGRAKYGKDVSEDYKKDKNECSIDMVIVEERAEYLYKHNKKFEEKLKS